MKEVSLQSSISVLYNMFVYNPCYTVLLHATAHFYDRCEHIDSYDRRRNYFFFLHRVGRVNLALKHSVSHFPLNFWDIACCVAEVNAVLPEQKNKNK